jgi:hypothetical protein
VLAAARALTGSTSAADLPRLRVSTNGHFLVTAEGRPFFWLGDDAAELCHRLDRKEAERYLQKRAEQRFTLIQTFAVADGTLTPNAAGDLPFTKQDPPRPNEPYWQHVDWIVARANALGLYVGLHPGSRFGGPERARAYGEFLGQRYKDAGLVWIVGHSRRMGSPSDTVVKALVEGLRAGDERAHLVTYGDYSPPDSLSRRISDGDALFDVYAFHTFCHPFTLVPRMAERLASEFALLPAKPILDVGPYNEDQPTCYAPNDQDYSNAYDVRWWLYHDLFSGAFGYTYGNHATWQMHDPKRGAGVEGPIRTWVEALDSPGAGQFRHARALLESRPFLKRIPDNAVVVPAENRGEVPGVGAKLIVATRSSDGAYAMVYVPASRRFSVDLDTLSGTQVQAWWFNPRNGTATDAGRFPREGTLAFTPPDAGETVDWVLVLDDVDRRFPPPGTARTR